MTKQLDLLEYKPVLPPVVDPNASDDDKHRLPKSSVAILERLQQGPATNVELLEVGGMRFGARLHDLRKHGHEITSDRLHDGLWVYQLKNGHKAGS